MSTPLNEQDADYGKYLIDKMIADLEQVRDSITPGSSRIIGPRLTSLNLDARCRQVMVALLVGLDQLVDESTKRGGQ